MKSLSCLLLFSAFIFDCYALNANLENICGPKSYWKKIDIQTENGGVTCAVSLVDLPNGYLSRSAFDKLSKPMVKAINVIGKLTKIEGNAFEDFTNLKYLQLANNNLSNVDIKSTNTFYQNVEWLDLSHNYLKNLSFLNTKSLNLGTLDLSYNGLTEIPLELQNFPALQKIDLKSNKINRIPKSLPLSYAVEYLDLYGNKLENLLLLEKFPTVHCLNVSRNSIRSLHTIASSKSEFFVKELQMDYNNVEYLDIQTLRQIPYVRKLSIRHNEVKELVVSGDVINPFKMQFLDLGDNQLTTIPTNFFRFTPFMETLRLNENQIKRVVPGAFAELTNLKYLDLSYNQLTVFEPDQLLFSDKLGFLNLEENKLKTLDYISLHYQAPNLVELFIAQNEISCNDLKEFLKFYDGRHVRFDEGVPCYSTRNVRNICCKYSDNDSDKLEKINRKLNVLTALIMQMNEREKKNK